MSSQDSQSLMVDDKKQFDFGEGGMLRDDGTMGTFMSRYTGVRRFADETNLIVSTNFLKKYTFDEVDVTNVVQELLREKVDKSSDDEDAS